VDQPEPVRTFRRLIFLSITVMVALGGAFLLYPQNGHDMSSMGMPSDASGMSMANMQLTATAQSTASSGMDMPGMDMPGTATTETGGHDMSPVDVANAPMADSDAQGNQPLVPQIIDGVKEFALTVGVVQWHILPDVAVGAYAYNGQVPGPLIRVTTGDKVRIIVTNDLSEPTSVHWHGLVIPNAMDGVADVTQPPIAPGDSFTYEFTVPETPGMFFYHTHFAADRQQPLGLYGAFLIDSASASTVAYDQEYIVELGEWRVQGGMTYPAMDFDGMLPNYFTINGKSYPSTETIHLKVGETVLLRFIGTGQFIHPMHVHGGPFKIVATDGYPVPDAAQLTKDTVLVGPGERYDVLWTATEPGTWLIHCHINHHITNNGEEVDGGGGLTMLIEVS
jgi:FtsP/CotA-like multicopper oxidase with cupredoxin domain